MDLYTQMYLWVIVITELMMIAMALHVLHYSGFTKEQKSWYLLTFFSVMLCAAAEFAVHCGYYDPSFAVPLTVITVIQFSLAPLLGVFFSGALGLHEEARVASVLFAMNVFVEVVLAPFGKIFYFDETGYHRGDLFLIYEAFYFISLIYLLVSMVVVGKRFRHRDAVTIVMILVVLVAGIVPMTVYKINITYIAVAISGTPNDKIFSTAESKNILYDAVEAIAYGDMTPAQAAADTIAQLKELEK